MAFSPDGHCLVPASRDKTVRLWDPRTGASCGILDGHSGYVTAVAFSPDGHRLASASWDATVRLWDPRTRACCGILESHSSPVAAVAFSPDVQRLASTSSDKTARLWDIKTHSKIQKISTENLIHDGSHLQRAFEMLELKQQAQRLIITSSERRMGSLEGRQHSLVSF